MPSGRSSSRPRLPLWSRRPPPGFARRLGVVHQPRERDLHDHPVPGLGGLAILAAAVVSRR